MFQKFQKKAPSEKPTEQASEEDYELFHTLCTVWSDCTYAQQYADDQDRSVAPLAAREIRKAIEESIYADMEIGLDHIKLLRRIESSEPI